MEPHKYLSLNLYLTLFSVSLFICASKCDNKPYCCSLRKEPGDCSAQHHRFYYNKEGDKCEEFVFTGCHGNGNNFVNWEDCEGYCEASGVRFLSNSSYAKEANTSAGGKPKDPEKVCKKEGKVVGDGTQRKPRFYYNSATGICEEFIYTGSGGNANNFVHSDECVKLCNARGVQSLVSSPDSPNDLQPRSVGYANPTRPGGYPKFPMHYVCGKARVEGHCQAYVNRYHFNAANRVCEEFVYSGCGGNENNFASPSKCMVACPAINVAYLVVS